MTHKNINKIFLKSVFLTFTLTISIFLFTCKKIEREAKVETKSISEITTNSAKATGEIIDLGDGITDHGHCWSLSVNPIIGNSKTSFGSVANTGSFTSDLQNLDPGKAYHVRAYVKSKDKTLYGKEISFTTTIVVATLTTTAVTSITSTTAVSGGNITADGGGAITAKGVCWAITTAPTISNSKTSDGTGTGSFTSNLSGLLPNTKYYLRAYATNSAGTSYGNEVSFTTNQIAVPTLTTTTPTAITLTAAVSGGNITADGGGAVTAKGVCWATTANPTINDFKTIDGTGIGSFTSNLSGLLAGTTYHIRAYATNSAGTAYGNEVSFTTNQVVLATVSTNAVASITQTTAVSGGNIIVDGGGAITARGVCWTTTANPTINDSKTIDETGTGSFTSNLTGLLPGTTYHIRAYGTNSAGTSYGNEVSFTTNPVVLATISTTAITTITQTTAVSGGNVTADGGGAITTRGVCWATTSNPTIINSTTIDGNGTGSFTSNLSELTPNTIYYLRAYATNSAGTSYGNEVSFTTSQIVVPTLTTTAATSITLTTVVSGGNITNDGGEAITSRGVCWATSTGPTLNNSFTSDGTGTGSYQSNVSVLLPGTTYYLRAYATNLNGTCYGNEITFTTVSALPPTLTTTLVSSITLTSAVSGGNITDDGGSNVTARGVCWSTTPNPTISSSKTIDGSGIGTFTSSVLNLSLNTTYYLRSYATNINWTSYGDELIFKTYTGTISDIDGNIYYTVTIGTQVWMAENLKTSKYNDNTIIPLVTVNTEWSALSTPGYCWYNNDEATFKATYGALYNWHTVDATSNGGKNICPISWHVPTDAEWTTLENYLGSNKGGKLKEAGYIHWKTPNTGATNESGFTALPGGHRIGSFGDMTGYGYWWTTSSYNSTLAYRRMMLLNYNVVDRQAESHTCGFSVRCINGEK